jgi:hypothetical protein
LIGVFVLFSIIRPQNGCPKTAKIKAMPTGQLAEARLRIVFSDAAELVAVASAEVVVVGVPKTSKLTLLHISSFSSLGFNLIFELLISEVKVT